MAEHLIIAIPEEQVNDTNSNSQESGRVMANRKEKRKVAKKEKRKQMRKELAELTRIEEEARLNDPLVQQQLQAEEEREKERTEREKREFEERERVLLEAWERKKAQEAEEEERRKSFEEENSKHIRVGHDKEENEDGWEYIEEGPPEIIWQGNEIIVKKNKVRVKKVNTGQQIANEDSNRLISNPLPLQSEAFADYQNGNILSAQQLLDNVAQQTPNFGTEQDKAHCPFHLKTGACRFGLSCSRIHFYPDKSCTLLIKNMYNGPGLSWEQDEGLEYTDEEVEQAYEEFYEDVHTEFLKFGELVNFKVCRNGSSHLRGNVYVHYKSLNSAVLAYHSINGRYFAGKQVQCEYVGVTRWKVAICGEFMKSKLVSCSRGTACNFIHCFRNPGGDYGWADSDKPPPRYWVKKMAALFGYSDESGCDKQIEQESPRLCRNSSRMSSYDKDRYHYQRSQSIDIDYSKRMSRKYPMEHGNGRSAARLRHGSADRKQPHGKSPSSDYDSDTDRSHKGGGRDGCYDSSSKGSWYHGDWKLETQGGQSDRKGTGETDTGTNLSDPDKDNNQEHERKSRGHRKRRSEILDKDDAMDSSRGWLDDDRNIAKCRRDKGKRRRQHEEVSALPDDRWDDRSISYNKELNGDWSDDHGESATTMMESADAKSNPQKAHKEKHSYCGDHPSAKKYDLDHMYSDSDSSSEHLGSGKSKGIQDADKNFDADRRDQDQDGNNSGTNIFHREHVNERGRWEPDEVVSFKHDTLRRKSCAKDQRRCREPELNNYSSDEYGNKSKSSHRNRSSKRK